MQEECEDGGQVCLELPLPPCFSLEKAVCSYGFFMMAPNVWIPEGEGNHGILKTKLRIPSLTQSARPFAVVVHISQLSSDSQPHRLCVALPKTTHLSPLQKECILDQVSRMLRLSNAELKAINAFHALHPQAEADGFGRLFRSPTLFEDMVKSLLLCNCGLMGGLIALLQTSQERLQSCSRSMHLTSFLPTGLSYGAVMRRCLEN